MPWILTKDGSGNANSKLVYFCACGRRVSSKKTRMCRPCKAQSERARRDRQKMEVAALRIEVENLRRLVKEYQSLL